MTRSFLWQPACDIETDPAGSADNYVACVWEKESLIRPPCRMNLWNTHNEYVKVGDDGIIP